MPTLDDSRIETLEALTQSLSARVADLETRIAPSAVAPAAPPLGIDPVVARSAARPAAPPLGVGRTAEPTRRCVAPLPVLDWVEPPRPVRGPADRPTLAGSPPRDRVVAASAGRGPAEMARRVDDLLGGRGLAWMGGLAVLTGLALACVYAVSHGWIDPALRVGGGALACAALLAFGVGLHERRGHTEAARTLVAVAVAGLFMAVVVASRVYAVIPSGVGFGLATVVGAIATSLALRWNASVIAALGIGGGLLAPLIVGAPDDAGTLLILGAGLASAVGVLIWRRWTWLAGVALCIGACQWIPGVLDGAPQLGTALAVLVGFGGLGHLAAIGFELRLPAAKLRPASSLLLTLNALVLAVVGAAVMARLGHQLGAALWLGGLALTHLALAAGAHRSRRVSADLALLVVTLAMLLADVAFALLASGPVLAAGWALTGVAFSYLTARRTRPGRARMASELGLGGHLGGGLLVGICQPGQLASLTHPGGAGVGGLLAVATVAAAALISGRVTRPLTATATSSWNWREALDAVGLALIAYLSAVTLHGPALVFAWALEAITLAALARRTDDDLAAVAALVFLVLAGSDTFLLEAPLRGLVLGIPHLGAAALALGIWIGASFVVARTRLSVRGLRTAPGLVVSGLFGVLYLASVAIIAAFQPADAGLGAGVLDLAIRQEGQLCLSGLWGLTGVSALLVGLYRDHRRLRLGALGLLVLTATKVAIYDLATLNSVYRITSFIAIGLLLLAGAYAYQQVRPTRRTID